VSAFRRLCIVLLAALAQLTSLQAQECSSSRQGKALRLEWPSTVEYRIHEHHEGRPQAETDYVLVIANDSQGRVLFHYTYADGRTSSNVLDPVAAEHIWWETDGKLAKIVRIVKDPSPVPDRLSCWQTSSYGYKSKCAPAGESQAPGCRDACYAERLTNALPPEKKGFPKCDPLPGGTADDLGAGVIQGIGTRGCRRTAPFLKQGNVLAENWYDEYGLSLREAKEYPNGDRFLTELISLVRNEPDLSTFRPPQGFESVTLEMHEVPCEQQMWSVFEVRK